MESREAPRCTTEARTAGAGKKRTLTQARREQNRAAQRIYRERQKKLKEGVQSRQRGNAATRALVVELRPKTDISTDLQCVAATSPSVTSREKRRRGGDPLASVDTAPEQQGQDVQAGPDAIGGDSSFLAHDTLSCLGIDLPLGGPLQGDYTSSFTITQGGLFGNDAYASSMLFDDSPSLFDTDITWEQPSLPGEESNAAATSDPIITVPSSKSSSDDRSVSATFSSSPSSSLAPSPESSFSSSSYPSSFFFADPYANARSLSQTAIFSALLHNALALGFNLAALADCTNPYACLSPFYRSTATAQDDPRQLIADALACIVRHRDDEKGVKTTFYKADDAAVVPVSLRPTLAQILVPHHASLDLIPFPQFRDRVIMLSAALPHQFNLLELKKDIYASGALRVATTVGNGGTGGYTASSKLSCQPWEPQCWAARGWFLRKWSLAIDHGSNEIGQAYM